MMYYTFEYSVTPTMRYYFSVDFTCSINGPCDVNAACISVGGPTYCQCESGFEGDGVTCTGIYSYVIM